MDKELYLVFIDNVGTNLDEKYVYQLYFSETPEVVWGEFWNICPCSIVPNIIPDKATINTIYEIEVDYEISTVVTNSCFSMQDCIDRIISLGWIDFSEKINIGGELVKFDFGEHFCECEEKIKFLSSTLKLIWENTDDSEDAINDLIEKIGGNDEW
jgi:hypothetical protein